MYLNVGQEIIKKTKARNLCYFRHEDDRVDLIDIGKSKCLRFVLRWIRKKVVLNFELCLMLKTREKNKN